ncbi:MAG TPA: DinB family protein [Candidatus Binatia bacterium]|nr:DinB family protein [Candidatus Binatia bacterium]
MSEAERIADLHRRAFDGDSWHGPHVFEILEGVDAARAARKPVARAHSAWEIVLHMRAWEDIVLRRLRGEVVEPTDAEDWPRVADPGAAAWKTALAALRETHDELNRAIAAIPDERLETAAPGGRTTLYRLAHGAVHHALYHAGQLAVLKRG